jgi:hypothetical protein
MKEKGNVISNQFSSIFFLKQIHANVKDDKRESGSYNAVSLM